MPSPFASRTKLCHLIGGIVATIGIATAPGYARVGVTSETNGDPLGTPPAQAERVLRVGIDIQANEVISTKADDRAHIVFLDGTSLTVAPNARLTIDKYVYDPNSKKGELAISVTKGVFRLVGGKISKTNPMVVNTPSATIGIRGGIGVFTVDPDETRAYFLFGDFMTVSANGRTEKAIRPGSQIVTRLGGLPGAPVLVPAGSLVQALAALEGRGGGKDGTADEKAKESGFRSDQGLTLGQPSSNQLDNADRDLQAISNARLQQNQGTRIDAGGASAFGAGPTQSLDALGPSSGPLSGPSAGLPSAPSAGLPPARSAGLPPVPSVALPSAPSVGLPSGSPSPSPSPPPPPMPPPPTRGATPAIGVGNGGLVPAIPASPSHGRR